MQLTEQEMIMRDQLAQVLVAPALNGISPQQWPAALDACYNVGTELILARRRRITKDTEDLRQS